MGKVSKKKLKDIYVDHCVETLKQSGGRITKARLAILECLADAKHLMAPKDLLELVHGQLGMADVDLATIYRCLEAFHELGLVHRIGPQGSFVACAHLDCDVDIHFVAHCNSCGKTEEVDLSAELLTRMRKEIRSSIRFTPLDHFFQMNGTCSICSDRRTSRSR